PSSSAVAERVPPMRSGLLIWIRAPARAAPFSARTVPDSPPVVRFCARSVDAKRKRETKVRDRRERMSSPGFPHAVLRQQKLAVADHPHAARICLVILHPRFERRRFLGQQRVAKLAGGRFGVLAVTGDLYPIHGHARCDLLIEACPEQGTGRHEE